MNDNPVLNTQAVAKKGVVSTTPGQRALGRMVNLTLPDPTNEKTHFHGQVERDLAADSFWQYFLPNPELTEEVGPERQLNRALLDWVKESPQFEASRMQTNGSMLTSAVAAGILYQSLMTDEAIALALKKAQEAEEAAQQAEQDENTANLMEKLGLQPGEGQPDPNALRQRADKNRAKAQALGQAATDAAEKSMKTGKGTATRAMAVKKAADKAGDVRQMCEAWGMEEGDGLGVDVASMLNMLKSTYQGKMAEITRLMGRIKGMALNQKAVKSAQKTNVIVEDGYTQNLLNLFPSERAFLRPDANPLLRAEHFAAYADRGLLGMVEGSDTKYEGGLVVAVDGSGSMNGDREIRAKALALGIAQAAKETNQPWRMFTFSSGWRNDFIEIDSTQDTPALLEWAEKMQGGGTDFDAALNKAMDEVEALGERSASTDVVMITDGECDVTAETTKRYEEMRERLGTRLIYLMVGSASRVSQLDKMVSVRVDMADGSDLDKAAEKLTAALR